MLPALHSSVVVPCPRNEQSLAKKTWSDSRRNILSSKSVLT